MSSEKIELGICTPTLDPDGTPTVLDETEGGCTVNYSAEMFEVRSEQKAGALIDIFVHSPTGGVDIPMAETDFVKLEKLFPGAVATGTTALGLGEDLPKRLSANAVKFLLHPVHKAAGDTSGDVYIPKCVFTAEMSQSRTNDGKYIYNVKAHPLFDDTQPAGKKLMVLGNRAAG